MGMRKSIIKKYIVKNVIKNDKHPNAKIIAYADVNNHKFKSLLKLVSGMSESFEVRPLNDYNDNNYLRTGKVRWEDQLVAMYATSEEEFHLWLGGAI